MKALSLWQPWAAAIAKGAKTIETRSWATKYRGPLAIHASKRLIKPELLKIGDSRLWQAALNWPDFGWTPWFLLYFGRIVAVCDLVDCRPTESFPDSEIDALRFRGGHGFDAWTERDMGDFSPGRFGWVLEDVRALENPISFRGRQGLFDVPDSVLLAF